VAITASTLAQLRGARTDPLGSLELKGKDEPVEAHVLLAMDVGPAGGHG
jgi:class 3 adenylate cyclase